MVIASTDGWIGLSIYVILLVGFLAHKYCVGGMRRMVKGLNIVVARVLNCYRLCEVVKIRQIR